MSATSPSRDPRIVAGLQRQSVERERLLAGGARRLGWKAGFGTAAAMAGLGTQAPLIGFLTDRTLVAADATVVTAAWARPVLEPEVAVRLNEDLAAGAGREAALAAIGAVATAIELVDLDGPTDDVEAILAANIFHRSVLLGEFAELSGDRRLDRIRVDVIDGTRPAHEGVDPAQLLGDLADVVGHLADQAPAAGDRLRAGDVIITGSVVPGIAVAEGGRFEVRATGLAPVAVVVA